jgi:hypothetical protein
MSLENRLIHKNKLHRNISSIKIKLSNNKPELVVFSSQIIIGREERRRPKVGNRTISSNEAIHKG